MTHQTSRRHSLLALAAAGTGLAFPAVFANRKSEGATSDEEIRIGQSAQMSGPTAPSLFSVMKGQQLALEEFNRRGGVGGRKVRLISLDDAFDPRRCVQNINTLIDDHKVTALYGLGSTPNVTAVLPIVAEKKVPLVGVYTGAPSLRVQHNPYFFTTMASYRDEVTKLVQTLMTGRRSRIGVVVLSNAFGKEMGPMVEEVAKENGATVVGVQAVDVTGGNAAEACRALALAKPDGLIIMAFGPMVVPIVKSARAFIGVPLYAPAIANNKATLDALGDEARGLGFTRILPNALRPISTVTREYTAQMARAKIAPDYEHFFGYMNLRVLLEGLRRTGPGVTPQSLVATLEKMRNVDLGGYKVDFSPTNHHGSKFVDLSVVGPGGKFIW